MLYVTATLLITVTLFGLLLHYMYELRSRARFTHPYLQSSNTGRCAVVSKDETKLMINKLLLYVIG